MPPVFELPATAWTYDSDLGELSAAAYSAEYRARLADGSPDPQFFNGIKVFRGEAAPDLVRIKVLVDGVEETLVLGVVDRSALPGGGGRVSGRDLVALALDRYPSAPQTLDGMLVDAAGNRTFRETFKGAMQRLAAIAGLDVLFTCPDYSLGRSVPVTTDRTVAEVMAELLRPLRWSERHAVDAWIEGTTLRVVRREAPSAAGTVTVDAARIPEDGLEFEKTALPAVDGVRVEGASYEVPEAEVQTVAVPGLPFGSGYSVSHGPFTVTKTVGGKTETWIDEGTEFYDSQGRMTSSFRKCTWLSRIRIEEWQRTCEFVSDSTKPHDGAPSRETELYTVNQIWGSQQGTETVRQKETTWRYFEDTGDVSHEEGFEVEKDEQATLPLPVKTRRTFTLRYRRSKGRVLRDQEIVEFDDATGALTRSFATTDQGPFNADAGQKVGRAAPAGFRMAARRVSAGPEPTSGKFRLEGSELLGADSDCEAVRQDLIEEHGSVRIRASMRMAPDLRVKRGKTLLVQNAPTWWPASTFYVTSVRAEDDGGGAMSMRVEGLAWAAAP